jgi:CheY-like chemotaxis protein
MIVDDLVFNVMALEAALSEFEEKFNVFTFYGAEESIAFFKETRNIDLIFMDINMPDKDGLFAAKEI